MSRTRWFPWSLLFLAVTAAPTAAELPAAEPASYLGPGDVVASRDGQVLLVLCQDAQRVLVLDRSGSPAGSIGVPAAPTGMALAPDGATLYVTSASPAGVVSIVDVPSRKVTGSIPAGHGATGPAVSPDGKRLYVCNRFDGDVSVIDLVEKKEIARVPTSREPVAAALAPDGAAVFVANLLPTDAADGADVATVVTAIDAKTLKPQSIRLPNGSTSARGIAVSPDGKYVFVAHILARYQMPTTQLERGWMNTNALSILDAAGRTWLNTVLLDDVDLGAANPWGVACSADGSTVCVTHAGTHELSVIDVPALLTKLLAMPKTEEEARQKAAPPPYGTYSSTLASDVPNDLAYLVDLRRRIRLPGNGPRGLALVGSRAYVAEHFTDTLAVVDLGSKQEPSPLAPPAGRGSGGEGASASKRRQPVASVALGPPPVLTPQRQGERLFHDADLCFQHWQSCASCHPGARADGLNWDLMNDGMGNPKNTRSMLLAHKTPPAMSLGVRVTAEEAVRSGITHIQFAVRPEEDAQAIDAYLKALQLTPSPRLVAGRPSESAERGRKLFESESIGCARCHPAPLYTDLKPHDVGSRGPLDGQADFDTPTLVETWRTAPYLHDGRYRTIKDLLVQGKHGLSPETLATLSPQQIDDLVEFVLSL